MMRQLDQGNGQRGFRLRNTGIALACAGLLALAGCNQDGYLPSNSRHWVALSPEIQSKMAEKGMNARSPILIRAYKKESELEIWKADASGEYKHLKTYPMCRWSGQLGPKKTEGDRQVPEGFYAITPGQLNPNSNFYLAFNVGYPNQFDRAHGRTGSLIMVHGACSSRGCFSMTDHQIAEIYALTREAFGGGQKAVQMQSLPFRFTPENLARYRADEHMPFWKNLKEGSDHFDVTKREPQVAVCGRKYVFNATPKDGARFDAAAACPPVQRDESLSAAVTDKARSDDSRVAELVGSGAKAVKRVYHDGDQHPSFKHTIYASASPSNDAVTRTNSVPSSTSRLAEVSQPDALASGAVELPADQAKGLNRQQLLAKATLAKQQEHAALAPATLAPAAAAAPATPAAAPVAPAVRPVASPAAATPPATTATALVANDPPKPGQPAFYQKWLGSLGGLTASASDVEEATPKAVEAPVPPKAPKR